MNKGLYNALAKQITKDTGLVGDKALDLIMDAKDWTTLTAEDVLLLCDDIRECDTCGDYEFEEWCRTYEDGMTLCSTCGGSV